MVKLSVNVNKIATLRNSRGSNQPCLEQVVKDLIQWKVFGITVHPRPDGRHILYQDVRKISKLCSRHAELNIEGRPSPAFMRLISQTRPHQCTLVPDSPQVLTSDQGWNLKENFNFLKKTLNNLRKKQIRSSLFIDPLTFQDGPLLKTLAPDRVEIYTGAYAKLYDKYRQKKASWPQVQRVLKIYKKFAGQVLSEGIQLNAGHDLNQKNLKTLVQHLPDLKEVSIGHALICESLYDGLRATLKNYLNILKTC